MSRNAEIVRFEIFRKWPLDRRRSLAQNGDLQYSILARRSELADRCYIMQHGGTGLTPWNRVEKIPFVKINSQSCIRRCGDAQRN